MILGPAPQHETGAIAGCNSVARWGARGRGLQAQPPWQCAATILPAHVSRSTAAHQQRDNSGRKATVKAFCQQKTLPCQQKASRKPRLVTRTRTKSGPHPGRPAAQRRLAGSTPKPAGRSKLTQTKGCLTRTLWSFVPTGAPSGTEAFLGTSVRKTA